MQGLLCSLFLIALGAGFTTGWFVRENVDVGCISSDDIKSAQSAWAGAVVSIGDAWLSEGCTGALREANGALDAAYSFDRPLLFKPTLTVKPTTFRPTREGALSYFVGQCVDAASHVSTDNGFALGYSVGDAANSSTWKGFSAVYFHDMTFHVDGDYCRSAIAQGKMTYTSRLTSTNYSVDKTFAYVPNPDGGIPLITVHHSSVEM
jgi:hypothetical protein